MEGQDMDLDTLQAQIDMSMAFTNELVESWMKASNVNLPSSSSRTSRDMDIDDYMRRPPRLGVGASVSESTGVLSRETLKLRNKLVGKGGKKRARDVESSGMAPAVSAIVISDDDEDSRARVITKKARLDPFAVKGKKQKAKKTDTLPPTPAAGEAAEDVTKNLGVPSPPRANVLPAESGASPATTTKRKKKKKHRNQSGEGAPSDELMGTAVPGEKRQVIVVADTLPPSETPCVAPMAAKLSPDVVPSDGPPGDGPVSPPPFHTKPSESAFAPQSSPQRLDPFGVPLLNLSGPPQSSVESMKKKRKKRKKKRGVTAPAIPAEVIDVDAEDGDEDATPSHTVYQEHTQTNALTETSTSRAEREQRRRICIIA